MSAKNQVIAGDYNGKMVRCSFGIITINEPWSNDEIICLNKSTVEAYQVVDENYRKSAASAIGRAALGGFVLGPVGLLAGLSARNKGVHIISIQFINGCKSLIEVDDRINKAIIAELF